MPIRSSSLIRSVVVVSALAGGLMLGKGAPSATAETDVVLVGPGYLADALPLIDETRNALAKGDHAIAAKGLAAMDSSSLRGNQVGDRAFLLAWSLVRDGRGEEAVPLIESVENARHVPEPYLRLTLGELRVHDQKPIEAARDLEAVPSDSRMYARAQILAAQAYHEAGSTARAVEIYTAIAERPDPESGTEVALWALAQKAGLASKKGTVLLRRLWSRYPSTAQGRKAKEALAQAGFTPTREEISFRLDALMRRGAHKSTNLLYDKNVARFVKADVASCRAWYAHGRSHFKRNNVTIAAKVLTNAGEKCGPISPEAGAPALYIAGKSLDRKKEWAQAAAVYRL